MTFSGAELLTQIPQRKEAEGQPQGRSLSPAEPLNSSRRSAAGELEQEDKRALPEPETVAF